MENIDASFSMSHAMRNIKSLFFLFILLATVGTAKANITFSDSLRISLLTCSEGPDAYERFGHSGIRINDLKNQLDIMFHWGLFDFDSPNFALRFIKGETDYLLGVAYTTDFVNQYHRRGLAMKEQVLNLDKKYATKMVEAILENYKPENRTYRYSYFFDNCATRPFNIIDKACGGDIKYDTTWVRDITLRDMVQEKTRKGSWLDFGTCLLVAGRSDKQASFREQMFLPDYLAEAYSHATINGKPLVTEEREILKMRQDIHKKINGAPLLSPFATFLTIFFIMCILLVAQHRRWAEISLKSIETLLLIGTGICGIIVWFLNFFSEHPSVDNNVNCLWLLPTNLIFAPLIWLKSLKKVCRIYFFIIFAAIIIYIIINFGIVHQYCHTAFIPIIIILILTSGRYCPQLLIWRKQKE